MKNLKWILGVFLMLVLIWGNNIRTNAALIDDIGFEYIENDNDTISITGYYGSDETVTVPLEINGKAVTSIKRIKSSMLKHIIIESNLNLLWKEAFKDCENLESVILPYGIKTLPIRVFSNCTNLEQINIPNSVEKIMASAFQGCSKLNNIQLPDGLKEIGENAFVETAISSIDIPSSVATISDNPFIRCKNLLNINVSCENSEFSSVDGILYDKLLTKLIAFPAGKENCNISESVTSIGSYAFYSCYKLTSLPTLDKIKIIPLYAFCECNNLTAISIPSNVIKIESYSFSKCKNLQEIEIGNETTTIGEYVFEYCENLRKIVIPNSVNNIGYDCFGRFNDNKSEITIYANPDSYARSYANEQRMNFSCINHNNVITDNAIPATCTENGRTAGSHCTDCGIIISGCEIIPKQHNIEYVNIPPTCTTEGRKYAYCKVCNATGDENGEFSDNSSYSPSGHKFDNGIITKQPTIFKTGIKTYTCIVCGETKTAQISKLEAPKRGERLKYSDSSYKVTISGTKNGTVEFTSSQTSKSSIVIPADITVEDVTYKVTSIAKNAFKNNKKLKKITIGSNITTINTNAFNGCKNLKTITIKSKNIKSVGKNALKGIKSNARIKVPSSKLKKYKKLFKNKGQNSTVKITK